MTIRTAATILALAALWIFLPRPASAQLLEKIDCASSHLPPPGGIEADCFRAEGRHGTTNCFYYDWVFQRADNAPVPRFWARYSESTSERCYLGKSSDALATLKGMSKYVQEQATNWSEVQKGEGEEVYALFDSKNRGKEGKCVAFYRPGRPSNIGVLSNLVGYVCKRPGEALDAKAAAAILQTVRTKS